MTDMKKTKALIAILLLAVTLCGCGGEDTFIEPTEEFYVNDFADVISSEAENEMLSRSVALEQKTSAQVVTVTVDSLNGEEISDYATEIGRSWGVGSEENNNGIVILLSESDREIFIAVGYGLEGALPDSKTGRIIDTYGLEYLNEDNFSEGLLAISKAVVNEIYIEYGIEPEAGYTSISLMPETDDVSENGKGVIAAWAFMLAVIAVFILLSKRRRGRNFFFRPTFLGNFHDDFHDDFHSGGNKGGGGFGGFSGGGGSFGGGGAGRGF